MTRIGFVVFAAGLAISFALASPRPSRAGSSAAAADAKRTTAEAEARAAIAGLAARLKDHLGAALKADGPLGAVAACQAIAPEAERAAGTPDRLTIRRTALRVRNTANAPDAFEARVLQGFVDKARAGADVTTLVHAEVVEADGKALLRVMTAIPMLDQPCLACHGSDVKPEVARRIAELYPQDRATGFKAGDVRGAFSVVRPLD